MVLAYEETGQLIPVAKGGLLRIAIVGPGNPITPGKFWVKWVERIEIEEVAPEKFILTPDAGYFPIQIDTLESRNCIIAIGIK